MAIAPQISVVIPLYNKEKYVRRAVDSVLGQTFRDFELIVVNDGSTDNGPAIVREYNDPRIRLIDQENGGESAARNRGISEARNELIAFLDADDEWLSDFLETVVHLQERFPGAGAYATGFRLLKGGEDIFRDVRIRSSCDEYGCYFDLLGKGMVVTSSSVAVRRSVFNKVGSFRVGCTRGADRDMWFRLGLYYRYACSPRICSLYYYYLPDNVCHTVSPCEVSPFYASILELRDKSDVELPVKAQAMRYAQTQFAGEIKGILFGGMRDLAGRRLREYRALFGADVSYFRLSLLRMAPMLLLRCIPFVRVRLVRLALLIRSWMPGRAQIGEVRKSAAQ